VFAVLRNELQQPARHITKRQLCASGVDTRVGTNFQQVKN
jgi:hypothetical protein